MSVEVVTVGQTEVIVTVTADPVIEITDPQAPITVEVQTVGAQGPPGPEGDLSQTFESVSQNLKNYPYTLTYDGDKIETVVYTLPAGEIMKTLNYTGEQLTSIVLSGDTPNGIDLTKTLNYTDDKLSSVTYS